MLHTGRSGANPSSSTPSICRWRISPDIVLEIPTSLRWISRSVGRDLFPTDRPVDCVACGDCPDARPSCHDTGAGRIISRPIFGTTCSSRQRYFRNAVAIYNPDVWYRRVRIPYRTSGAPILPAPNVCPIYRDISPRTPHRVSRHWSVLCAEAGRIRGPLPGKRAGAEPTNANRHLQGRTSVGRFQRLRGAPVLLGWFRPGKLDSQHRIAILIG